MTAKQVDKCIGHWIKVAFPKHNNIVCDIMIARREGRKAYTVAGQVFEYSSMEFVSSFTVKPLEPTTDEWTISKELALASVGVEELES
jgi:hypothetical protein